jgi:hypothetical protein
MEADNDQDDFPQKEIYDSNNIHSDQPFEMAIEQDS